MHRAWPGYDIVLLDILTSIKPFQNPDVPLPWPMQDIFITPWLYNWFAALCYNEVYEQGKMACWSSIEDIGSISPDLQQTCLDVLIAVLMSNKERITKARRKTEEKWYYTLSLSLFVCLSLTLSLYVFICYKKACPRKGTHSQLQLLGPLTVQLGSVFFCLYKLFCSSS